MPKVTLVQKDRKRKRTSATTACLQCSAFRTASLMDRKGKRLLEKAGDNSAVDDERNDLAAGALRRASLFNGANIIAK